MANKQNKKTIVNAVPQGNAKAIRTDETKAKFNLELKSFPGLTPYLPGLILFAIFLFIGFFTYQDYGICWDEVYQRAPGVLSYDYVFNGSQELFNTATDNHGAGYELLLVIFEKMMNLTDSRDIYMMRHIVTNILFLTSALAAYVLIVRLFKNRFLASIGFLMLVLAPRLYAHSFFNSKDIPFMCMITITLMYLQIAFEKNKTKLFLIAGLMAGYATSIRIMGVLLVLIVLFFLVMDLISILIRKEKAKTPLLNILLFFVGFCVTLYLGWPYLWPHPIQYFFESFGALAHFMWKGSVLLNGDYVPGTKLPWTYFPQWFLISNPEIWLITGFAGIVWLVIDVIRNPLQFFRNTNDRQFLIYLGSFFGPILAVILMHSVIYDDWRHLYFVYPPFVLMAVYFINKMLQTRFKMIVQGICILEVALTSLFMYSNHPHNQVYFNYFVSHDKEYLRKNYELEYWGCTYKQGLEYLLASAPAGPIKVNCENEVLLSNNMLILRPEDRARIQFTNPEAADYFMSNFRNHPYDYPGNKPEYTITVLNSTIFAVFKQEKDPVKQKQIREASIIDLTKSLSKNQEDPYLHAQLGDQYFRNGQYDSSVAHHMRALQLNASSVVINELAGNYFGKQRYREAIDLCQKAVELNPGDVNTMGNMGLVYMRIARFDSAIYILHRATAIDPKYTTAYINLALTYKAMGNMDSAKKYEAEAQKTNPQYKLQ